MTNAVHVTKLNGGDVYGHETTYCNESCCAGDELYFGVYYGLEIGGTYELGRNEQGAGIVIAEII